MIKKNKIGLNYYIHTKEQFAFVNQQFHELDRSIYEFVALHKLEHKKQKSIYVGLDRSNEKIDTKSKISLPSQIKSTDAKKLISLNNEVIIAQCKRNSKNGFYYGPFDKFELLNEEMMRKLKSSWKFKSGIYGNKLDN